MRYIQTQVESLCEHGHAVHFSIQDAPIKDEDGLLEYFCNKYLNVSIGHAIPRSDRWKSFANELRGALDYCRYLHPDFRNAVSLRERAEKHASDLGLKIATRARRLGIDRSGILTKLLLRSMRGVYTSLPPDPSIVTYLRQLDADLVLLTGLVWPRSGQADYVLAARKLGIPTGYIVNSWDNLTNKGDVKAIPDAVYVWNEEQRREASRLHGIRRGTVTVTGAPLFDRWFERQVSEPRAAFCSRVGLPNDGPFVLYPCSSPAIAPDRSEQEFFREWLRRLRACDIAPLRHINVLVRPHPFNTAVWNDFTCEDDAVAVYPRHGRWIVNEGDRDEFFDAMHYSAAVVGVNTSAMIETAIVGARTLSLDATAFGLMQDETLHFKYLTSLGIVEFHSSFEEHFAALATIVQSEKAHDRKALPGVIPFVRPFGNDRPSTPIATEALERQARKRQRRTFIPWWRPAMVLGMWSKEVATFSANYDWDVGGRARRALQSGRNAIRRLVFKRRIDPLMYRTRRAHLNHYGSWDPLLYHRLRRRFDARFYLARNPDVAKSPWDPFLHFMIHGWREGRNPNARFSTKGYASATPQVIKSKINPFVHFISHGPAKLPIAPNMGLTARLREQFFRKVFPRVVSLGNRMILDDHYVVKQTVTQQLLTQIDRFAEVEYALSAASRGDSPILVGPWFTEVGYELLYWVPFLRWYCERYQIDRNRLVIISRGNTSSWYADLLGRYVDIFGMFSPAQYHQMNLDRMQAQSGKQKQYLLTQMEHDIYAETARRLGLKDFNIFHPRIIIQHWIQHREGLIGYRFLDEYTRYRSIEPTNVSVRNPVGDLGRPYVAVKFYFREALPDTEENRKMMTSVILSMAQRIDVVLLSSSIQVDDHTDFVLSQSPRVHRIDPMQNPAENLALQTAVIAGSEAFVGTYGGMSYVANCLGKSAVCFESEGVYNHAIHTDVAHRKLRQFGGNLYVLDAKDLALFELVFQGVMAGQADKGSSTPSHGAESRQESAAPVSVA